MSRKSLPTITNRDVKNIHREIKEGALEGQIPHENRTVTLAPGYVMNILGEVTTDDERVLPLNNQKDAFPFLAIMDNASEKPKKIYVADIMRDNFGPYIEGYAKTRFAPEDYTLAPKNGNRSDFMLSNLKYVKRHSHIVEPVQQDILEVLAVDSHGSPVDGSVSDMPHGVHNSTAFGQASGKSI